ncbi:glycosyltransferase family 2 protein [Streptomyces sp. NPDC096176]|uniref:glycosyltransferase family 2 protein n=1 Tax=Streptomyces sp. NPDC096176 TaxID=3366079 RepID=UPI003828526B
MTEPLISVFIRNRNEARVLGQAIDGLRRQRVSLPMEIVVLDNESTDESADTAEERGARVFTLPRALFGYGRAINLGVELCRGRYVVLLSSHSIPQDEDWLAKLIAPMQADPTTAAVFCNQIPPAPRSRLEMRRFSVFPAGDRVLDQKRFVDLCARGTDPYEAALFSNSACAFRREAALAHPFRDLMYAEDRAFVVDLVMDGHSVAFVHDAVISYERGMTWRSGYTVGYRAQVSKRLIRELAATYTGVRHRSTADTLSRLARAAFVGPGLLVRLALSVAERPGLRRASARYSLRATGATLGMAKGVLRWRRHTETVSRDDVLQQRAREACTPWTSSAATGDTVVSGGTGG